MVICGCPWGVCLFFALIIIKQLPYKWQTGAKLALAGKPQTAWGGMGWVGMWLGGDELGSGAGSVSGWVGMWLGGYGLGRYVPG